MGVVQSTRPVRASNNCATTEQQQVQPQSNNKCIWAFNACGLTLARKQDGPEHLIEETDHFLEEQAVVSSNGTPFKDVVRKNRLLIARCKSALDRVMDDTTRRQVCPLDALSSS
jgi:hypothetical protein